MELNIMFKYRVHIYMDFPGGSVIKQSKNLPAVLEIRIWFLDLGGMEKEMATHSSILALKIPQTETPGTLQSMGSQRVREDLATKLPPPYICRVSV